RAGAGSGPGFRAGPRAGGARHAGGHANLRRLSGIGFRQRYFHVVAQVGAALAARTLAAAPAAHELAEQVVEDVGHRRSEVWTEAVSASPVLESGMADMIVGRTLLRVLQDVVGLAELLEP